MQILSRYHYDPLDRLVIAGPSQRFYQAGYLATELDDQGLRSIMRHAKQPLAQQRGPGGAGATTLLATDLAQSPLLISLILTQVTERSASPSTAIIASVTLPMIWG